MPKVRAYGADATLKACREAGYGVAPLTGYRSLDFKSTDLSSAQPLGDDPLLGRGRNAQDPYRGLITDEGQLDIPLDLRGTGFWLTGLFGDPVTTAVAATGTIAFAANPSPGDTITLNGTVWTFVSGTASGDETEIQASLEDTLDQLVSDLNASADAGDRDVHLRPADRHADPGHRLRHGGTDRQRVHHRRIGGDRLGRDPDRRRLCPCLGERCRRHPELHHRGRPSQAHHTGVLPPPRHGDGEPELRDGPGGAGQCPAAAGGAGRGAIHRHGRRQLRTPSRCAGSARAAASSAVVVRRSPASPAAA